MKRLTLLDQHGLFPNGTNEVNVSYVFALARESYAILLSMLVETISEYNDSATNDKDKDHTYYLLGTDK